MKHEILKSHIVVGKHIYSRNCSSQLGKPMSPFCSRLTVASGFSKVLVFNHLSSSQYSYLILFVLCLPWPHNRFIFVLNIIYAPILFWFGKYRKLSSSRKKSSPIFATTSNVMSMVRECVLYHVTHI